VRAAAIGVQFGQFRNLRGLFGSIEGGIFFYPTDEDLSVGTPMMKMPLCRVLSVYIHSETAVALHAMREYGSLDQEKPNFGPRRSEFPPR
jgi:hypothetical protein